MHIVIVALMAQALPVVYIVAQFREVLHRLDVMGLKPFVTAAYLASVVVTLKYSLFPSEVIGTTATLRIPRVTSLGYALAFYAAIGMLVWLAKALVYQAGIGAPELPITDLARTECGIGKRPATPRAVDVPADVRGRPFKLLAAMLTDDCHFLGLGLRRTFTRAVPLFGVLIPTAVRFFGDNCPTSFAGL